jgi:ribosomal protein L12E/L44/L45/RPP1/RPP2
MLRTRNFSPAFSVLFLQSHCRENMPSIPTSLDGLNDIQKEEMIASLAVFLVGSAAGDEAEMSAEKLQAVATAAGCSLSAPMATLFSSVASKVKGGVESYKSAPGGGGGGGGGGGAAAGGGGAAAAEEKPEEKEEEEEMDLGGGMDMFGGDEGGGGGDY